MPRTESPPAKYAPVVLEWLLRAVCATMLAGHAWMCWNGQMPLRALLWDEELVSGAVQSLAGMEWGAWVSSMEIDEGINRAIRVQAWVFFLFAITALLPLRHKLFGIVYLAATLNLGFLAWLKYHDAGMGLAQLFEHSSQFCLPLVLALFVWRKAWTLLAQLALAATFIAHGLFAIDLPSEIVWLNHPQPGNFVEMTMLCLGLESEAAAIRVLLVAGIADFVAAGLIFLRGWPRAIGLVYMLAWGFLTALARPWAYFEPTAASATLLRWIPEMLYRAPHFGLPFCLLVLLALRRRRAQD